MKAKEKKPSGSVKINPDVLKEAKFIALKKEVNIQDYVTGAVSKENKKEKSK